MNKLYGHAKNLHELEPYYCRHVSAMTTEALHSKSDIAAELAFRDMEIARLEAEIKDLKHQMSRMVFDPRELGWGD